MASHHPLALMTPAEMNATDAATIAAGSKGFVLMQRAAQAVALAVLQRYSPQEVLVLCGSGNNGGDGFLAAEKLRAEGWPVTLALLGDPAKISGDAALAAQSWQGAALRFDPALLTNRPLVIDAVFGTGLSRVVDGEARAMIDAVNAAGVNVVAVDIPSGIDGQTGAVRGAAIHAALTVTFHRKKRGHVLQPGREHCGEILLADIGLAAETAIAPVVENDPSLWLASLPWPDVTTHKYQRGAVLVQGGEPETSGAAKLSALAALRAGAGVATIAVNAESLSIYAASVTAVMTQVLEDAAAFQTALQDARMTACVIGPGAGISAETKTRVLAALATQKSTVLDADALTVFAKNPAELFAALRAGHVVLTPHEGEFARLFPSLSPLQDKVEKATQAAALAGAVVVLKGSDTVIAAPDGRAAINVLSSPFLATAGSGDVLAGMIGGLLAGGMSPFDAACAAVWLHGCAGAEIGAGLIADDIIAQLPFVLQFLHIKSQRS